MIQDERKSVSLAKCQFCKPSANLYIEANIENLNHLHEKGELNTTCSLRLEININTSNIQDTGRILRNKTQGTSWLNKTEFS